MKVIVPLRIGVGLKPLPRRRGHDTVVTGRLSFDLSQPGTFLPDPKLWPIVQAVVGTESPFDSGMYRPRAEVMLWGDACSPAPVEQMNVELRCGTVYKRVRVTGDRHWQPGLLGWRASRPVPFTRMPVGWDRAFGGAGFAVCPVGQGHDGERRLRDGEQVALPNIESPESPLLHPQDLVEPVCFAPIEMRWAAARPDGTYSAGWLESRFPESPADEDPALHNLTPMSQWLPASGFTGGESIEIRGMHPERPVIASRVPAVRMWAFIQRQGSTELEAMEMRADTLSLLPGSLLGVLHFRVAVADTGPDARAISCLMLAAEWADQPKPRAHYVEVHRLRTDPVDGANYALQDQQLMPQLTKEQHERREAARERQRAARAVKDEAFTSMLDRKIIGPTGSARAAFMLAAIAESAAAKPAGHLSGDALHAVKWPEITDEDAELGDVDLAGVSRAANQTRAIADQLMAQSRRDMDSAQAASDKQVAEMKADAAVTRAAVDADKQALLAGNHLQQRSPLEPPAPPRTADPREAMAAFADQVESGEGTTNEKLFNFMLNLGGMPVDAAQEAQVRQDWAACEAQADWSNDKESNDRLVSGMREALLLADSPSAQGAGRSSGAGVQAGEQILAQLKFEETPGGGVAVAAWPIFGTNANGEPDLASMAGMMSEHSTSAGEALPLGIAGELDKFSAQNATHQEAMSAMNDLNGSSSGLQGAMDRISRMLDPSMADAERTRTIQALRSAATAMGRNPAEIDAHVTETDLSGLLSRMQDEPASSGADFSGALAATLGKLEADLLAAGLKTSPIASTVDATSAFAKPTLPTAAEQFAQYQQGMQSLGGQLGPSLPEAVKPDGTLDFNRVGSSVESWSDDMFAQLDALSVSTPASAAAPSGESPAAQLARELALGDPKQGRNGSLADPAEAEADEPDSAAWSGDDHDHPRLAEQKREDEMEEFHQQRLRVQQALAAGVSLAALPMSSPSAKTDPRIATSKLDLKARQAQMEAIAEKGSSGIEQASRNGRRIALSPMIDPILTPPEACALGALVAARIKTSSFAGRDLADIDLRGADLRGADFTGTFFENARFEGADLRGARCKDAVFSGAVLSDARFDGADLSGANLSEVVAHRARFDGAQLRDAKLFKTDFSYASLREADFEYVTAFSPVMRHADCTASRWEQTMFTEPDFTGARLDRASLKSAAWTEPTLSGCSAQGSNWTQARIGMANAERVVLDAAQLDGALFAGGRMNKLSAKGAFATGAGWMDTELDAADFQGALLDRARFSNAPMKHANFAHSTAAGADFAGSDLEGADFQAAQLMHSQLRAAKLPAAQIRSAMLRASDLDGALLDRCDLSGSDSRNTLIELPHDGTHR